MSNYNFNRYYRWIGINASDINFDVWRPDYTAMNQTGSLVQTNKSIRYDVRVSGDAEPSLPGAQIYDLYLDRALIQPGDIIVVTGYDPTSLVLPNPVIPIITVIGEGRLKTCVGLLTDHTANICDDANTILYQNVKFMWSQEGQPKTGRNKVIEDSMPFDRRKVIMYRRQGTGQTFALKEGMRLVETLDGETKYWFIVDIHSTGNFTTMQVEEDPT